MLNSVWLSHRRRDILRHNLDEHSERGQWACYREPMDCHCRPESSIDNLLSKFASSLDEYSRRKKQKNMHLRNKHHNQEPCIRIGVAFESIHTASISRHTCSDWQCSRAVFVISATWSHFRDLSLGSRSRWTWRSSHLLHHSSADRSSKRTVWM